MTNRMESSQLGLPVQAPPVDPTPGSVALGKDVGVQASQLLPYQIRDALQSGSCSSLSGWMRAECERIASGAPTPTVVTARPLLD
jgi:hypothetical protein